MILVSILLTLLSLAGVAYIVTFESIFTVDGLFMSIILLTMAGVFGLDVLLEMRQRGLIPGLKAGAGAAAEQVAAALADGARKTRGFIESIEFYEAPVGMTNKSIVMLRDGENRVRMLVLKGNVRTRLMPGRNVELIYQPEEDANALLEWQYR